MEPECAPAADRRVYRYGQTKPVVVYNLKVVTDSDAYADNKVYEYLHKKLGDVVDALAKAMPGEDKEDLLGDVLRARRAARALAGRFPRDCHQRGRKEGQGNHRREGEGP